MREHDKGQEPGATSGSEQLYLLALRGTLDGDPVTRATLARRVGVSAQAASEMLRRLASKGFVRQDDANLLHLTTAGQTEADAAFRRHALVEWLLTSVLGLSWAESDEEAMRLQGAISPRVERALDELLRHPLTCPHGNPISLETERARPTGTPLSEVESGTHVTIYRVTEQAEEDAGLLSYLEARGLRPGAHITVLARSEATESLTVHGPFGQATLGLRPASLVRVLPGDGDPSLVHRVT